MTSLELPLEQSHARTLPLRTGLLHRLTHAIVRRPRATHPPIEASEPRVGESLQTASSSTMNGCAIESETTQAMIENDTTPNANAPAPVLTSSSQATASASTSRKEPTQEQKESEICDICQEEYPINGNIQDLTTAPSTESFSKRRKASDPSSIIARCNCDFRFCSKCIQRMFVGALTDPTQMPPKCCKIFQIHLALPYLTTKEAKMYREKFEEWSCRSKVYCPVPTCSAFIPERLQPTDKATHPTIACPKCRRHMCSSCHARQHPGRACNAAASAELQTTLALITKWGYKRCPKCGTGVKRMFGCSHMQCVCGAHWCWACLRPYEQCRNLDACAEADDGFDDAEDGEPDEENLDSRIAQNWETMDLDFGDEPSEPDEMGGYAWGCEHRFSEVKKEKADAEVPGPDTSKLMECCRCWTRVQPGVAVISTKEAAKQVVKTMFRYDLRSRANSIAPAAPPTPVPSQAPESLMSKSAWECETCGIVHCKPCMIAVLSRRNNEQEINAEAL